MFDLSRCIVIADVLIANVTVLGLFLPESKHARLIELDEPKQMTQQELYRFLEIQQPIDDLSKLRKITMDRGGKLPPANIIAVRYRNGQRIGIDICGVYSDIGNARFSFLHKHDANDTNYVIHSWMPGYSEDGGLNTNKIEATLISDGPVELLVV
jgi:hypothetical protein